MLGAEAAAGLAVDARFGEPPTRWHPVARFGAAMGRVERLIYRDSRAAGVAHTAIGAGLGIGAGLLLRRLLGRRLATVVATSVAVAGRMLDDEAQKVAERLLQDDLPGARRAVSMLVGRSTTQLDETGVARAVIETVAENTVDAVTAPLMWAAVAGAPGVLAHRAINTMDAMVGHHNDRYEHYGWCSARLDDIVNWVPARATALLVLAPMPSLRGVVATVRGQARRHPSPNGGVVEAAYAHRLGVVLGGVNHYADRVEDRGVLGVGPSPTGEDVERASALRREVSRRLAGVCAATSAAGWFVRCLRRGASASYDRRR